MTCPKAPHGFVITLVFLILPATIIGGIPIPERRFAPADAIASDAAPPTEIPPSAGNVLRYGVHVSVMGTLDPHRAAGSQDRAVADMVFNGLLRYHPGDAPRIEPDLAVAIPDFEMRDGRQVWTVAVRRGVMFHPGPLTEAYELSADDVAYSLRRAADPIRSAYAGEYAGMMVEVVDRYVLRIIPETPLSTILFLPKLTDYAGGFIVSRHALEAMGDDAYAAHPVGTGPFRFRGYEPGGQLLLTAHDAYYRGKPRLDGVELHFLPDIRDRENGLRAGRLDVIVGSGDKEWIARMERETDLLLDFHGVGEVIAIYFNTRMPPLDDVRVRRAIVLALDRDLFMEISSRKLAGIVYSPVPGPFLPGGLHRGDAAVLHLTHGTDLGAARELLAQAGFPDGFAMDLVSSEKRIYQRCYEILRGQLAAIGIDCRIEVVSHSEMHRRIRHNPQPIVVYGAWRPNADSFLSRFFHSSAIIGIGSQPDTNFSFYDTVDPLIEAARREVTPSGQISLWQQAQIRILTDMAVLPLFYTNQCYARRSRVDYGHHLVATMALYPQFTELTRLRTLP